MVIPALLPPSLPGSESYKQLGLLTYFTSGEKETRAWTIHEGFTAPQAAGVIHTGGWVGLAGWLPEVLPQGAAGGVTHAGRNRAATY